MWTTVGVVGLAGCGFALSFAALRDLAIASGLLPSLAFLWPLVVDGFIVVATAAAFRLKGKGVGVTWYPWTALLLFAAVSVAGNAIHASESPSRTVATWVATIVSAVPAVALLVASHLLVVMTEHGTADQTVPGKSPQVDVPPAELVATPVTANSAPATVAAPVVDAPALPDRVAADPVVDLEPVPVPAPDAVPALAQTTETTTVSAPAGGVELVEWVRAQYAAGLPVTGATVAAHLHVTPRTGRRRLDALKTAHPGLFDGTHS